MTLGTVCTSISERLMDDNNQAVPLARVRKAVNDAIQHWKKRGRNLWFTEFEEDVTLTIGNSAFSLVTNTPLAIYKRNGVVITDNQQRYELTKVTSKRFDAENRESSGRPYIWVYRNDAFELYFLPDQAYVATIRGRKDYEVFNTDGSDDSETNDWLDEAGALIEYEALSRLQSEYRMDLQMGEYYSGKAKDEFKAVKALHNDRKSTTHNEISSILI